MNETIRTQIAALEDLRLPELRARYAKVLGETTLCPNRRFLIRKITEALLAQAEGEQHVPATPSEGAPQPAAETTPPPTAPDTSMDVEQARRVIMENVDPMGYDTAEQYVEECYGQVAPEAMPGLLVEAARIILDNAAAAEQEPEGTSAPLSAPAAESPAPAAESPAPAAESPAPAAESPAPGSALAAESVPATVTPKLTKLDVPALQALHLELIGRPTSSSDKAYLVWRLRQAQKGKIPVGRREPHRATTAEPQDHKVLPLRMEAELVAKLDEARERLGLKSRMDLFRRALHGYLAAAGEHDVAALFAPEA